MAHRGFSSGDQVLENSLAAFGAAVDLGYRYSDYGQATYDLAGSHDLDLTTHTITAGVNFKF